MSRVSIHCRAITVTTNDIEQDGLSVDSVRYAGHSSCQHES